MGTSRGMNISIFTNVRFAGPGRYTPAIIPAGSTDGKHHSAKIEFNCYQNEGNKRHTFKFTAWGRYADTLAKAGSTGKEITIFSKAGSYEAKRWVRNAQNIMVPETDAQGQVITQTKVGFKVTGIILGDDSATWIAGEVEAFQSSGGSIGRPIFWQVPGHQDAITWATIRDNRNAFEFAPGMTQFGVAEVYIPQGAQIVDPKTMGNNAGTGVVNTQMVGNTGAVANTFQQANANPNPATNVNAGPAATSGVSIDAEGNVIVNGQNMGKPAGQAAPAGGGQGNFAQNRVAQGNFAQNRGAQGGGNSGFQQNGGFTPPAGAAVTNY